MGLKKCCDCLSCGRSSNCMKWCLQKTRYYRWKLRTQMFASVFCSASCVLSTMAITICLSTYFVLDGLKTNFVNVLYDEETALIIQKARMASSQIETFTEINQESAKKMAKRVTEMITPSKLAPDYPLSYTDANPLTWEQIPGEEKIDNSTSYNNMNYAQYTSHKTDRAWTAMQKITSLTHLFGSNYIKQ